MTDPKSAEPAPLTDEELAHIAHRAALLRASRRTEDEREIAEYVQSLLAEIVRLKREAENDRRAVEACSGAEEEIERLQACIAALEAERDKLAKINSGLVTNHNTLLMDGSKCQSRAEAAEAERDLLSRQAENARRGYELEQKYRLAAETERDRLRTDAEWHETRARQQTELVGELMRQRTASEVRARAAEAALAEARQLLQDTPTLILNVKATQARGEQAAIDYAAMLVKWHPRVKEFLSRAPAGGPLSPPQANCADDLRAAGWSVAVHNDYQQGGERRTFWLLTNPNGQQWVKGEGRSDTEALNDIRSTLDPMRILEPAPTDTPEPKREWFGKQTFTGPAVERDRLVKERDDEPTPAGTGGWRPIAEAPKTLGHEHLVTIRRIDGQLRTRAASWYENGWWAGGEQVFPEHWQPLPAPPEEPR